MVCHEEGVSFHIGTMGYVMKQVAAPNPTERGISSYEKQLCCRTPCHSMSWILWSYVSSESNKFFLTEAGKKKYINGDTELEITGRWGSSQPTVDVCLLYFYFFFILLSSLIISYCWKQATFLDETLL